MKNMMMNEVVTTVRALKNKIYLNQGLYPETDSYRCNQPSFSNGPGGGSEVQFTHTSGATNLPTPPTTITASSSPVMSQLQAQVMASRATDIDADDDELDFCFAHPSINRGPPVNAYIIAHKQVYPSK
ncbi:unnamed protein product [Lactuca virosa]|uniref:Uncharacterized protein n=1 Tax=Lactuca virosa TaxID=75947 RepID=A0AAU9N5V0_9ASTR|nr:unnamed protein product [Lactuca virosa]